MVDEFLDIEHIQFISWQEAQVKFGLLNIEQGDWDPIIGTIMHEWDHILERDSEWVEHKIWIGFFTCDLLDSVMVLKDIVAFNLTVIGKPSWPFQFQSQALGSAHNLDVFNSEKIKMEIWRGLPWSEDC